MSDIPAGVQAVVAAVLGSGSGLLATALRGAKRFTSLEDKVEELEGESVNVQGRLSTLEFHFQKWADRAPIIDNLPNYLEKLQGIIVGIQQNVGDLFSRLESLKSRLEDLERRLRVSRSDIKGLQDDKRLAVLETKIQTLSAAIERLRDEDKEFLRMETFVSFTEEQGRQWNEIQRTLGRLEGLLKTSLPSRPTPPPIPRVQYTPPKK